MTTDPPRRGPVLIENVEVLPDAPAVTEAHPVPDGPPPAMLRATRMAARRSSWRGRLFWGALTSLLALLIGNAAWEAVLTLAERNLWLGRAAMALAGIVIVIALGTVLKELAALARLSNVETIKAKAAGALASGSVKEAHGVLDKLHSLYAGRDDLADAAASVKRAREETVDADALLELAERHYFAALDRQAAAEVQAAARTVAGVTALVPIALADVLAALSANMRMIRRIAEIYDGRAGIVGTWRLFRAVAAHLIATGAVAVGDDLIGAVAGGGVLAKVSRRFGEGVVNGALTARVGVAAMEVCRPLPFAALKRPSVTSILQRAMSGMFAKGDT